jgi:hypothetical protein
MIMICAIMAVTRRPILFGMRTYFQALAKAEYFELVLLKHCKTLFFKIQQVCCQG